MYRLEYWYMVGDSACGNVYGNPDFPDGTLVKTSSIQEVNGDIIRTKNNTYKLGVSYINNIKDLKLKEIESVDSLIQDVINWGKTTGILSYSSPKDQALKTVSEVGEFADNVVKGRDCKDDIGDIIVTLILQAELQHTSIYDCLKIARDEIIKRKGKMINGVFVKEGDNG